MTWADIFRFAANALSQHRRRSLLSLLGVVIGVVAVVSLTALGEGARRYVMDQFAALGSGLLVVMPGKTDTTGGFPGLGGAPNDLTLEDARALERQIPEVLRVVPITAGATTLSRLQRSRQAVIIGTTPDFRRVRELAITRGRFLPAGDFERGAPVVVLGRKLAKELFEDVDPVGQAVRVGDWRMRVIGLLAPRGTQMGLDMDEAAMVPVATGLRMSNRKSLMRVIVQLRPGANMQAVKQKVIALVSDRHGEEDITCISQEAVLSSLSSILRALTLVVAGIAGISLSVAGIGIMNVMLVSVSERTPEVGLLKALGATRRQILLVFLFEAVLLSTVGGAIGLGIGWLLIEIVVAFYPAVPASPPAWAVGAVVGVSLATGTVFGVLPAWRASQLDPVAALAAR
jgi:putative ABC transport system permease protein